MPFLQNAASPLRLPDSAPCNSALGEREDALCCGGGVEWGDES